MQHAKGFLASLGVLALVTAAHAAPPRGGLYGVVKRGPTQPVCVVGLPCDAPAAGLRLTFSRPGQPNRWVRTDRSGAYRILLTPGVYTVRTDAVAFGVVPEPARVHVPRTGFRQANFSIDTGIR
jgi:hypothetical protein